MALTHNELEFLRVFKNSIKIDARTISVKTLLSERNIKRIDYSPHYQRNYVWDNDKQTFFIESVILGTEIPPLIFFRSGLKLEVIDGRQRFETLKRFKDNEITLTSKGLLSLVGIAKQNFNKLDPEKLKEIFLESNLRVFEFEIINEPNLPYSVEDKIKKEIFRRYNTGITPLNSSEVDNAKYDEDSLSEIFKNALSSDDDFSKFLNECFYSNETKSVSIDEQVNYLRRLFIIEKFPISKYATGKDRREILDLLYDFSTQEIENMKDEFVNFKNQLKIVHEIRTELIKEGSKFDNKFLYECLFWAVRILKVEDLYINWKDNINDLKTKFSNSISKYTRDDSHYYSNIIERFTDTASYFEWLVSIDFSIYLRNSNFKNEINEIKAAEKSATQKIDEFDHLRINKPAPISTPIDEIRTDVKTHRYLVRPSYQRQERITELKASSIIESILLGINLPPIFVLKKNDGTKEVIDGQQRLLSILGFIGEQYMDQKGSLQYSKNNAFKLKGLKILSELNGVNYSKLSEEFREKILDFTVDVIIIDQNINPEFEATDLFIRLNNKPYPIQSNSFEMWNSIVDSDVIKKIKEITVHHASWFYSKEINPIQEERKDRMENEELITILAFVDYNIKDSFEKSLGFYNRKDRITCRIKSKSQLSDFLQKLDQSIGDKEGFLRSLDNTNKIILSLFKFFNEKPSRDSLNSIFNIKNTDNFRRSFQDFYILWIILLSYSEEERDVLDETFVQKLKAFLGELRNIDNKEINAEYLEGFLSRLKMLY